MNNKKYNNKTSRHYKNFLFHLLCTYMCSVSHQKSCTIKRWPSDKANHEKYAISYFMSLKELKVFIK